MSNTQMDTLYLQGREAEKPFEFYYTNLRPLLLKYARHICQRVLRQVDDHLVIEMVDDLLIEIDSFRNLSRFSTWAHARFYFRCITEHRYRDRNLGRSLEEILGESDSPYLQTERTIIEELFSLAEIQSELSAEQRQIVSARLEGHTFEEIGKQLGTTRFVAFHRWQNIVAMIA